MTETGYHNHTTWSDGSATVPEMVESAQKAGLREFGISDHYVLAPGSQRISWAIAQESLDAYVADVKQSQSGKHMRVRLGLEVDYFPETIELTRERLAQYQFDYLIGSVHFVDDFPIDFEARSWEGISQEQRNNVWRGYWRRLRETAKTGLFDIIGHFDLPKKFGFRPSIDLVPDALAALDSIAAAGSAIEINNSLLERTASECYQSLQYLQESCRRKIPILINADAHSPGEIVRHFERARKLAVAAGYTELVRFDRRRRSAYPI